MKFPLLSCLVVSLLCLTIQAQSQEPGRIEILPAPQPEPAPEIPLPDFTRDDNPALKEGKPMIQLALALDTSSSMGGLIAQAKAQLWSMVNALVDVKKDGNDPIFQVALYEYGRNSLPAESGFVRQVVPLTDNLDLVSERLMELQATRVSGSDERCGQVLYQAVQQLGWSRDAEDLKVICIAGNETFTSGPVPYRVPCELAVKASISINTIFCGSYEEGHSLEWNQGAKVGDGAYTAIDHNLVARAIETPQDTELVSLNAELNDTYIPYTAYGVQAKERQIAADEAARGLAQSSFSDRARLKATRLYKTSDWDLVEASQDAKFELDKVDAEALPEEIRKLPDEEKRKHLAKVMERRDEIKKKIAEVSEARNKFLAKQQSEQAATLNKAVVDTLKTQATKKKFK